MYDVSDVIKMCWCWNDTKNIIFNHIMELAARQKFLNLCEQNIMLNCQLRKWNNIFSFSTPYKYGYALDHLGI